LRLLGIVGSMDLNAYYKEHYASVVGTGAVGFFFRMYHQWLERESLNFYSFCIEVGSGEGEHFEFVKHEFNSYLEVDIRNSLPYEEKMIGRNKVYGNAESLDFLKDSQVDRLIATCILVHLDNPEKALNEWRRVVKNNGQIDIYVPCEPGFVLQIAQKLTTKRKVRKLGIDYERIQYREHRNHLPMMEMLIGEIFSEDFLKKRSFPTKMLNWNLRLFDVYQITKRETEVSS
jgi:phosphatidylethanolamine/phosphatidyl-N-methylethanolamine N-methyltransferase